MCVREREPQKELRGDRAKARVLAAACSFAHAQTRKQSDTLNGAIRVIPGSHENDSPDRVVLSTARTRQMEKARRATARHPTPYGVPCFMRTSA